MLVFGQFGPANLMETRCTGLMFSQDADIFTRNVQNIVHNHNTSFPIARTIWVFLAHVGCCHQQCSVKQTSCTFLLHPSNQGIAVTKQGFCALEAPSNYKESHASRILRPILEAKSPNFASQIKTFFISFRIAPN